ncbi:MAG: carboxypeptidase-like regulatory domain-containing protein, partial [Acidobacteriota bacterium]
MAVRAGYVDTLYEGFDCDPVCDPLGGTPLTLDLGQEIDGVDLSMKRLGSISGTVRDAWDGSPVDNGFVDVYDPNGLYIASSVLDRNGRYEVLGLRTGRFIAVAKVSASGYGDQVYPGGCDLFAGTPIEVTVGQITSEIDFALDPLRGLRGRVTQAETGVGIPGVQIDLWSEGDRFQGGPTGADGRFSFVTIGGTWFLSTDNGQGGVDQVFDGIPCPDGPASQGGCDPFAGTPVVVSGDGIQEGLDFALDGVDLAACIPTDTALCLNGGRFRVEMTWRDIFGEAGRGKAQALTSDTGYFWFFDPQNVEAVVKVLDACVDPFDRFWVFAAGLTDVEATLTVTDTLSGETRSYANPLGSPFEPVLDTDAFATCDAPDPRGPSAMPSKLETPPPASETRANSVARIDACSPSPQRLCLANGRFAVEASWSTTGLPAAAAAVPLTADTGYFWFFDDDNVEVVLKVLDACAGAVPRFWVFTSGLTDVGVDVTVTDTET